MKDNQVDIFAVPNYTRRMSRLCTCITLVLENHRLNVDELP